MAKRDSTVEQRLKLIEDKNAILETMNRFVHAADYGLNDEWVDCFVPNGVFRISSANGLPEFKSLQANNVGHEALLNYARTHPSVPAEYHKHLMMVPDIVEIGPDIARVRSYFAIIYEMTGKPVLSYSGRYLDVFQQCSDGRWRIQERVCEITGWA